MDLFLGLHPRLSSRGLSALAIDLRMHPFGRSDLRECGVNQKNIVVVPAADVLPAVSVAKTSMRL